MKMSQLALQLLSTNTIYKILSGIILYRIKPYTKDIIRDYQCGLMNGKSTIDHILTIKQLVEKYYEFDKHSHMHFVDYK